MSKSVSLPIEQLILGRKLKFPIHGADGILLIASGVVLTTDIKHRLLSRGIRSVAVDETEVSRLTIETPQAVAEQLSDFDDEINRRIEMARADFDAVAKVWTHSSLTWKRKLHIFSALVESKLLYSMPVFV